MIFVYNGSGVDALNGTRIARNEKIGTAGGIIPLGSTFGPRGNVMIAYFVDRYAVDPKNRADEMWVNGQPYIALAP
jgi:hypothetical protein